MQNGLLSPLRFVYSGDPETLSPCQMVDDEVVPAQLTAERSPDIITMTLYTSRPLTRIKGLAAPCFQTYIFLKIIFGYFWHAPHCWDAELHHTTCEHGMVHKNGTGGWTVEAEFIGIDTVSMLYIVLGMKLAFTAGDEISHPLSWQLGLRDASL